MERLLEMLKRVDRAALAPLRAEVWKGALTPAEFVQRNECLYGHVFGLSRMRTYGFREGLNIPTSLDAVLIYVMLSDGKTTSEAEAMHLASVLTLNEYRKKGLATEMIQAWLAQKKPAWSTLFSGVGEAFYQKHGYREVFAFEYTETSGGKSKTPSKVIDATTFAGKHRSFREKYLLSKKKAGAVFYPDALWWDWLGAIYQFTGKTRGLNMDRGRFWEITHSEQSQHVVAGSENGPMKSFDVWWSPPGCKECLAFLSQQAAALKMPTLTWWTSEEILSQKPAKKVAMLRASHGDAPPLVDVQLGDWW